jgi:hypothetical protein
MNSHPAYREAGSTRMLHDRDADFAQLDTGVSHHFKMDEEAAAAAAAIASVNASQYANYAEQVSPMQESSSQNDGETNGKIKRARSMQKITRNRKITSCLQCRERKQKVGRRIQRARSAWLTPPKSITVRPSKTTLRKLHNEQHQGWHVYIRRHSRRGARSASY